MEAIEVEEIVEVKRAKPTPEMKRMREISNIFNSSASFSELKVKLDLAGIDIDQAEQEYTKQVARVWPKFLERFKDEGGETFSFKKFMELPAQVNSHTKARGKTKLPWCIEKSKDRITVRVEDGANDKWFASDLPLMRELADLGIDGEAEMVSTMLYELAF